MEVYNFMWHVVHFLLLPHSWHAAVCCFVTKTAVCAFAGFSNVRVYSVLVSMKGLTTAQSLALGVVRPLWATLAMSQ